MKFRKKPVVIEALRWEGEGTLESVRKFLGDDFICWHTAHDSILIRTLEGTLSASLGDWIIRGVKGEHYACKPDIFERTYEQV